MEVQSRQAVWQRTRPLTTDSMAASLRAPVKSRKAVVEGRWLVEEHESFVRGLRACEEQKRQNDWAFVSDEFVPTRTPVQVRITCGAVHR